MNGSLKKCKFRVRRKLWMLATILSKGKRYCVSLNYESKFCEIRALKLGKKRLYILGAIEQIYI